MQTLHFAPVQGHTDAAYRHFHANIYGEGYVYYTPFIRLEKDTLRNKDLKDINSDLNRGLHLVPQIIFKDSHELNTLVTLIEKNGFNEIDLNMGCPFPLQTGHGRGAGAITNEVLAQEVVKCVNEHPHITFSVKMRLGLNSPDEWKQLLPFLNQVSLTHITLHPRVAKQQYSGEVNMEEFSIFLSESKNGVVYNGDLKTPEDIENIMTKYPDIYGVMVGRGILGRPSLFKEFQEKKEWDKEKRVELMLSFHNQLFQHYSDILCGDSQIISKIQPFWEYAEEEIGRKAWKAIKKATNMAKYQTALALI